MTVQLAEFTLVVLIIVLFETFELIRVDKKILEML